MRLSTRDEPGTISLEQVFNSRVRRWTLRARALRTHRFERVGSVPMKRRVLLRSVLVATSLLASARLVQAQPNDGLPAPVIDRADAAAGAAANATADANAFKLHEVDAADAHSRFLVAR